MRAALRIILYVLAVFIALPSGILFGLTLDAAVRFSPPNTRAFVSSAVSAAAICALLWLRTLIPPTVHRQRVEARRGRWAEHLIVAAFFLMGLVMALGINAQWPEPVVEMIALAGFLFALLLINRFTRPEDPNGDGRCPNCGYDLRGATEPRCSECGTAFESSSVPPE